MTGKHDDPLRGIALMLIATLLFAGQNVFLKFLSADYPAAQIYFMRCLCALPLIMATIGPGAGWKALRTRRLKEHFLRSLSGMASNLLYISSLKILPLATSSALFFSGPLFVGLLSILFLREKIGVRHGIAMAAGFGGVLIMLHPDATGLSTAGLMALGSAIFYAFAMVSVRALGSTEAAGTTTFYFMFLSVLVLLPVQFFVWRWPPDAKNWLWFAIIGLSGGLGQLVMTRSFQYGQASLISPFNYSGLLWATLLGFAFWGEWPAALVFLGGAIVIASGVYLAYHEGYRRRKPNRDRLR